MNITSSSLKENLIAFFQDCEILFENSDLQDFQKYDVKYKFTRQKGLLQDYQPKIIWKLVQNHFEEKLKKLKSINPCVNNLIECFGLTSNIEKAGFISNEFVKKSRDWRKLELVDLFFKYKKLPEEIELSIPEYATLLIKGSQSQNIYLKITSQLIEFKTKLKEVKIHNFIIRIPTEEELDRIIYDNERNMFKISNPDDITSVGPSFLQNTQFWVFTETQQTRLKKLDTILRLYQKNELNKDIGNNEIITDFKRLMLALRLYNGNYIGIRSLFINKSFVYESDRFEPWREYPFLNSDFGHFRKVCYSLDLKSKEIQSDDVKGINDVFGDLMFYEQNPLKQIDRALNHFFEAFEQIYPVYIFTELIMAFETLLNENIKSTSKEEVNLIKEIRDANTEKKGLKILKKYMHRNSIQKSIDMLNQLLYPGEYNEDLNKFFSPSYENSCYRIRNNLLHGNLSLDSAEIRKKISDLEEYVRLALLKIIELRINDKLDCNEENYFEKLNKASKVNVRESSNLSLTV